MKYHHYMNIYKKLNFSFFIIFFTHFFLSGCSGLISRIHKDLDNNMTDKNQSQNKRFNIYQKNPNDPSVKSFYKKDPKFQVYSSQQIKDRQPSQKRQYVPLKTRMKAEDFTDKDNEGSLWGNDKQDVFLFSKNNQKGPGDIVILKVQDKLKREMATELARFFKSSKPSTEKKAETPEKSDVPKEDSKVYDKISSLVIDEINGDHLLIRGKKDVLFNSRKRSLEVQALINKKDISDDDSLFSSQIIDSSITILK
jgi:flagellar L-ring protein precursor FlgH